MSPTLEILHEMKDFPAAYLGSPSISKLAFFLRGYEAAATKYAPEGHEGFLAGFRDFVHDRFGTTRKNWETLILEQAGDESSGLELFWRLLQEYEARGEEADRTLVPDSAEPGINLESLALPSIEESRWARDQMP